MNKNNSRLAFSLIELSIVILIIGVLVIGISKGSRIIKASKLKTAQSLTTSSPVNSMDGITMWLETTLDKSFTSSEMVDTAFGATGTITTWKDINPFTQSPNNATQTSGPAGSGNRPRYMVSLINGLPALNFDGQGYPNGDFFDFDGTKIVNTNYSIFVVDQRRDGSNRYFIAGRNPDANANLHLGYRNNTTATMAQYVNDLDATIPAYSGPTPRIHAYRYSSTKGKNYNINGTAAPGFACAGGCDEYAPLIAFNNAYIGKVYEPGYGPTIFYYGDIGEIIMFNRYITDNERTAVEKYLKAKWAIR